MTDLDPRALEAAALAVAEETDRDGRDYYALKLARAAVSAYLAEAGDGWRDIKTAPKDGTWFQAYRPAPKVGVCQRVVTMRWLASEDDFAWPADVFDEYNPPDIEAIEWRGFYVAVYTSGSTFTHWRPLPAPPAAQDHRQPEIRIGQFVIRHAPKGIWIGRTDGEGGEFPTQHVEDVIAQFYRANF